ncbi:MAG TPA: urocanate hydratase [Acidimicrobiales bacterium]|nr:urocanate hydratase [Acidimicrobiales bacterium]
MPTNRVGTSVRALRGSELRCRGWRQETLLRLLENTLENGEDSANLVIYGGFAKAARDDQSLRRTMEALLNLEANETLVIQSGKPVGVFPGHSGAPLVLMATSNLVGRWANEAEFDRLEQRGLIMWGGYTAGDWQYIGSQGIVQGTYQTFAEVAGLHFGGSLVGELVLTAGLGGMGGAQPLAVLMAGGVSLCVEVDPAKIERRVQTGYLQDRTDSLSEALEWVDQARAAGDPRSIGLLGNASTVFPELLERGVVPSIVTDQTSTHDLRRGYIPGGLTPGEAEVLRQTDPERLVSLGKTSVRDHLSAMIEFMDRGAVVFEYGNNIRAQGRDAGVERAMEIPGFVHAYIRPLFCRGIGPFRWIAVSGDERDIDVIDAMVVGRFEGSIAAAWIPLARAHVRSQGLPSRIAWLGHGERTDLALMVNEAVASGAVRGPVAFTRDHLDAGGVAQPLRETEGMLDGSDAVSDWPLLDALLNAGNGADLVAIHGGGGGYSGYFQSAGVTVIADGTPEAATRLHSVLTGDTGIGVLRYADAGYDEALDAATASGLCVPALRDGP